MKKIFDAQYSIILLDEPSQNLDMNHQLWLKKQLAKYTGILILVSHDRDLLDSCVSTIWEIKQAKLTEYTGNYSSYVSYQEMLKVKQREAYYLQQRKIRRLHEQAVEYEKKSHIILTNHKKISSSEFKANSYSGNFERKERSVTKQHKRLINQINAMEKIDKPRDEFKFHFYALNTDYNLGNTLFNLTEGNICVGGKLLFAYNRLKMCLGDTWLLEGDNGSGKTTFFELLFHKKLTGHYTKNVKIGYFRQDISDLNEKETVLENILNATQHSDTDVKNLMNHIGITTNMFSQHIDTLSGGERVKLSLLKVLVGDYQLLLLDEPTNYLDILAMDALKHFINKFPGSVFLISHDKQFNKDIDGISLKIHQKRLICANSIVSESSVDEQIALLRFKKMQRLSDSSYSIEEIKGIEEQIQALNDMRK